MKKFYNDELANSRYSKIVEVYYKFAYYMCCVPYRFLKLENGNYVVIHWKPQRILCFAVSIWYCLYIIRRSLSRWKELYEKSHTNGTDPLLYIRIIESSAYVNYSLSVIYAQSFKGYSILKYLNQLNSYSTKHQVMKPKWVSTTRFLYCLAVLFTTIGALNFLIYINFQFNHAKALGYGYDTFFINAPTNNSSIDNFLLITGVLFEILVNVRDLYAEFFFLVSILPLWLVSNEFQQVIAHEMQIAKFNKGLDNRITLCSVDLYQKISALSRSFSKCFGYPLMSYFLFYLVYHSIGLDRIFIPVAAGEKLYDLEYLSTLLLNYGLGAHFSFKMSSLKQFVTCSNISNRFTDNKINLISHWYVNDFASIKASALPITLHSLIQFVGQIMVVFLICVQSKLSSSRDDEAIY